MNHWLRPLSWLGVISACLLVLAAPLRAQNAAPTPDISKESERKSISFFKTHVHDSLKEFLTNQQITRFERTIRAQVEGLNRFDKINDLGVGVDTPEDFVKALQERLPASADEIAKLRSEAFGKDFDFKYKGTVVTGAAIDQVLNSAYAYEIELGAIVVEQALENYNEGREEKTRKYWRASFPIRVEFFKIRIVDEKNNKVPLKDAVQSLSGGRGDFIAESDTKLYLLEKDTPEYKAIVQAKGTRAAEAENDRRKEAGEALLERTSPEYAAMVEAKGTAAANEEMEERMTRGREKAIQECANDLPGGLEVFVRSIPEFKIRAAVVEVLNNGNKVTMRPGRADDVRVDDYYELYQVTTGDAKKALGWTKVRKLGPGLKSAGMGASAADEIRSELQTITGNPEIDFMLEEKAMFGFTVDLGVGYEFIRGYKDQAGNVPEVKGGFRIDLFLGYDLGRLIEFPELWIGFNFGVDIASSLIAPDVSLDVKWAFYLRALVIEPCIGVGITKIFSAGSSTTVTTIANAISTGATSFESDISIYAKIQARVSLFLHPHVHIFLEPVLKIGPSSKKATAAGVSSTTVAEFQFLGFAAVAGIVFYF